MTKAVVLRESAAYVGAQGPRYGGGVSAESVGSEGLWFGRVTIGPGDRTKVRRVLRPRARDSRRGRPR
jgi:uncharacterized RmlC-like cupin family protein